MTAFLISALSVFVPDQYLKHRIRRDKNLPRPLGRYMILRYSKNRGMFMNLLENHPRLVSILTGSVLILLSIFSFFVCRSNSSRFFRLAMGLMLGGAASNVYDHLTCGFVTDYISFCHPSILSHIVYNLADFAVFLSAFLIVVSEAESI